MQWHETWRPAVRSKVGRVSCTSLDVRPKGGGKIRFQARPHMAVQFHGVPPVNSGKKLLLYNNAYAVNN